MTDDELLAQSEAYLDAQFGPGMGRRHTAFLDRLASPSMRQTLHGYHVVEGDESLLSVEENYLLGVCVLCATRAFGPAAMFAKTLRHKGVAKEKILEAVSRLSMWIGGVPAAEALGHIQKALAEWDAKGLASMDGWFPEPRRG